MHFFEMSMVSLDFFFQLVFQLNWYFKYRFWMGIWIGFWIELVSKSDWFFGWNCISIEFVFPWNSRFQMKSIRLNCFYKEKCLRNLRFRSVVTFNKNSNNIILPFSQVPHRFYWILAHFSNQRLYWNESKTPLTLKTPFITISYRLIV